MNSPAMRLPLVQPARLQLVPPVRLNHKNQEELAALHRAILVFIEAYREECRKAGVRAEGF